MVFLLFFLIIVLMIITLRIKIKFRDFEFNSQKEQHLSKNYKIDVISTYGGNVHRFLARNENIEKFFGSSISRVFNMSRTFNKMDLYKTYPKNTIIIDDDLNNCNQAVQLGQKALWYKYYSLLSPIINKGNKHQHKIDKKQITPVSSFIEIEKLLSR